MSEVKLVSNGIYWQARWHDAKGVRQVKSLGSKKKWSQSEALALCRALEINVGEETVYGELPRLSEWCERYLAQRSSVLAASTRALYQQTIRTLCMHWENDPPITEIRPADAADWRARLAAGELRRLDEAEKPIGRVPGEAAVSRYCRDARAIFNAAIDQDIIQKNPFAKLRCAAPKVVKNWAEVSRDQLNKIMEACPSHDWKMLFALCRLAGLRRGEALALRWEDVDFSGNKLRINSDIDREDTKHYLRVAPIEPAYCPSGLSKLLLEAFEAAEPGAMFVCGQSIVLNNINRDAKVIIRRAKLQAYAKTFHTLRKNCATEWASRYPMPVVADWLGHNIAVAAEHYQKVPEALYLPPPARRESTPVTDDELATMERQLIAGEAVTAAESLRLVTTIRALKKRRERVPKPKPEPTPARSRFAWLWFWR